MQLSEKIYLLLMVALVSSEISVSEVEDFEAQDSEVQDSEVQDSGSDNPIQSDVFPVDSNYYNGYGGHSGHGYGGHGYGGHGYDGYGTIYDCPSYICVPRNGAYCSTTCYNYIKYNCPKCHCVNIVKEICAKSGRTDSALKGK